MLKALPKLRDLVVPSVLKLSQPHIDLNYKTSYRPEVKHIRFKGQLEENLRSMLVGSEGSPAELSNEQEDLVLQWFADTTIP